MEFTDSFSNVPNRQPLLANIMLADGALSEDDFYRALRVWFAQRKEGPGKVMAFGEVLLRLGLKTTGQLAPYLSMQRVLAMAPQGSTSLGALVLQNRLLRPAQLIEALRIQKLTGERLGQILVNEGYIPKHKLAPLLRLQGRRFTKRMAGTGRLQGGTARLTDPERWT